MSPENHQRVRKLFDQALERPEAERLAFVEDECGGEPEVYHEVIRLLGAHSEADAFLEERPTHRSTRIDRYLIKSELGHGAMGVVYEAVDPLIGRTVAIKVISLEATTPKEVEFMRDGLFREARSAGGLSHPGIVIIFDVGQENDTAFITMERVEGPTLEGILDSGGVREQAAALDILRQAAAALDYAHQNGVVHRDVKPANIMLHKGTTVKITDFGIAKMGNAHSKTLTGMVMGTPSYMSPEQIETHPLDGKTDQFSLAVVAYEVLTGVKPFEGNLLGPLMHSIIYGERPSARAANPSLPEGIDAVFERGLRRFPNERYANCAEFVAALEACFTPRVPAPDPLRVTQTLPLPIPTPPPPRPPTLTEPPVLPPVPNGKPKSVLPYILAGCGVVALAGGYLLYRHFVPVPEDPSHRVTAPPKSLGSAPEVGRFTADPPTIEAGAASTLRWEVTGATEVTIDQGVGNVAVSDARDVKPLGPTTYVLMAKGPGGNTTARVTVNVQPKPPPGDLPKSPPEPPKAAPPRIPVFRASPATLKRGERFELEWSVEGSKKVAIDHGVGQVAAGGSKSLLADATITYTLTATGSGGTATAQATVTVAVETAGALYDEAVAARRAQQSAKALGLFQQAANRGEARAMLELGLIYRSGDGVPKDIQQSVSWFEKAAKAGNSSGMDYMGAMYANGEGVPKDDRRAMDWYGKAAAAGNPVGMDALGQMYRNGRGVPQNYPEAIRWFTKAADAGNASASYHLGMMYENGWGTARNAGEAMNCYRKAAAGGDREAARHLSDLERQPAQTGNRQTNVRIAGNVPWTDTGIDLRKGDQVTIEASGMIRAAKNSRMAPVSPAGLMTNCSAAASVYGRPAGTFPAPNLPCWSLLGRIQGPSAMLMEVGQNKTFTATSAGRLYLGINDDNFGDNTGSWNAVVTVSSGSR